MSGFHKKGCNCKPTRATQCNFAHQPQCPARNLVRTCTPDFIEARANICVAKLAEWNRCFSAPPSRRSEIKNNYVACRSNNPLSKLEPVSQRNNTQIQPRKGLTAGCKNKETKQNEIKENIQTQPIQRKEELKKENVEKKSETVPLKKTDEKTTYPFTSSDPEEHEYLHFLLMITEDILRNNIYSDEELEKLFESHTQANIGRLDEGKMRARIEQLKTELNLPLARRKCHSQDTSNQEICACCPAVEMQLEGILEDESKSLEKDSQEKLTSMEETVKLEDVNEEEETNAEKASLGSKESQEDQELEKQGIIEDEIQNPDIEPSPTETENVVLPLNQEEPSSKEEENLKGLQGEKEDQKEAILQPNKDQEEPSPTSEICPNKKSEEALPKLSEVQINQEATEKSTKPTDEDLTCEKLLCCPVNKLPAEMESANVETCEQKDSKTSATPSVLIRSKVDCIKPETCVSDNIIPKSTKKSGGQTGVSSLHSIYKIVHKDDPKKTESYIIYYNPNETEEYCYCSVTLQRTALKIQSDDSDGTEYILVDAPVCIPRSWLDTKVIPVLVQNASSMLVDDFDKESIEPFSLSKVNLFQERHPVNEEFDNFDSVSFQIKKAQTKGESSDYDLTPQRDVADNVKDKEPIVKDETDVEDVKQLKDKNNSKDILKVASSEMGDVKVTEKTRETTQVPKKNVCIDKRCPGYQADKEKLEQSDVQEEEQTFKTETAIEKTSVAGQEREPRDISSEKKTPRCSFKDLETVIRSEEWSAMGYKGGICSKGSCHRDICPKRFRKSDEIVKPQRSISEQITPDQMEFFSKLSGEAEDVESIPEDYAAKYHYLLTDASTSTTSLEKLSRKSVEREPAFPQFQDGPVEKDLKDQYALLLDENYQTSKESLQSSQSPSSVESRSKTSEYSEPEKTPSLETVSDEKVSGVVAETASPTRSASIEIERDRVSSVASTAKSDQSDLERRQMPDLKIFQYSTIPPRILDTAQEDRFNDLTYMPKRTSDATTENVVFEAYRRASEILQIPTLLQHPTLRTPQSPMTINSPTTPGKSELKVRYSLTRDMYAAQQDEDLIAKLDHLPSMDSVTRDKEAENIDAITERMKQFRKISGEDNEKRRFQISNPDNFEIKRVSAGSTVIDDEPSTKAKRTCCGLAAAPKSKKRVHKGSVAEESNAGTSNK